MAEQTTLSVRVTPRSARDEVVGWRNGELIVRLRAPPVKGQANAALQRFLARRLRLTLSQVEIVAGATARSKRLRISGLSEEEVRQRLDVRG